ncbi:MAG: class I mannose-6-phosphate isomerase [Fibrobacteres bacterium]|nr:class I mannose-6-phosphate isomerase [Fibrobacterota bacterium]
MNLYPLKFEDNFKDKIWGGDSLGTILGRKVAKGAKVGESWELSEHESGPSVISNGHLKGRTLSSVVAEYPSAVLGEVVAARHKNLPLLFKFIDANDKLSIQVHPDDKYAALHENSLGKTEAWYVVHAEKGAKLISGLAKPLTRTEVEAGIKNSSLEKLLQEFEVKSGDCFFVPAGTVHAIESGLIIYEVQEVSDITYRLYDWGRVDDQGKPRDLHIEKSLKVMDFNDTENHKTEPVVITESWGRREIITACEYFILYKHSITGVNTINTSGKFKVITPLYGTVTIEYTDGSETLKQGETALLPASLPQYRLKPFEGRAEVLVTDIPVGKDELISELTALGVTLEQMKKLGGLL